MSTYVVDWALQIAPTADIYEAHILAHMAAKADHDGCGVFISVPNLALACHCSVRQVQRSLQALRERKLIGPGDMTSPAARIYKRMKKGERPEFYDVLVPFEWYSEQQMGVINDGRDAAGRRPLTARNRPPIMPAPEKPKRADAGKKRPERSKKTAAAEGPAEGPGGDYESPGGVTASHLRGRLAVTQICNGNLLEESVSGGASRRPPEPPADKNPIARAASLPTDQRNSQGDLTTACAERGVADGGDAMNDDSNSVEWMPPADAVIGGDGAQLEISSSRQAALAAAAEARARGTVRSSARKSVPDLPRRAAQRTGGHSPTGSDFVRQRANQTAKQADGD